ncbi:leukocyte elastase inhibitor-like [Limanda limanda]|uniref:leukocyte elastase inhibitor-like n=1 Tax=Limanda limanda TaxID=27771 RepID=UPI0029C922CF|nr:leukocyte elastase inhibitor-like [Limanda limanda]
MAAISSSITAFALDLFRILSRANPSGNMLVSPLSIKSALAMVYLGARGDTAAQMAKAMSFQPGEAVHAEFKELIEDIDSSSKSFNLKTANRLYWDKNEKFLTAYVEDMRKYYQADLKIVDIIGAMEASRKEINTWVEQQTEKQIKDLLKPGIVSAETKLVLVNAIYLNADWKNCFYKEDTEDMYFRVSQNETKSVRMIIQKKKLPYKHIPDHALQILELPYVEEELSMFILLPEQSTDGSNSLLKLVKDLTLERLNEWTDKENMVESVIHVQLPKFKLEEDYELKHPLSKLGMTEVFRKSDDLSGMNGGQNLFLTEVIHKAFVEVNEEGTEAVAATPAHGIELKVVKEPGRKSAISVSCGQSEGLLFKADHPFLFFVRHNKTKSILFLGRFSSPQ